MNSVPDSLMKYSHVIREILDCHELCSWLTYEIFTRYSRNPWPPWTLFLTHLWKIPTLLAKSLTDMNSVPDTVSTWSRTLVGWLAMKYADNYRPIWPPLVVLKGTIRQKRKWNYIPCQTRLILEKVVTEAFTVSLRPTLLSRTLQWEQIGKNK